MQKHEIILYYNNRFYVTIIITLALLIITLLRIGLACNGKCL